MIKEFTVRMSRVRSLFVVMSVALIFMSCNKTNMKWVYYDETICADRWEFNINNEKLKDNVTSYFKSRGVRIYEIEIFTDRAPDNCSNCDCKTGRRFKCKVKRLDVSSMNAEGFYEQ